MGQNGRDLWQGLGIGPGDLLIPKQAYLNSFWPVVALDQYTSQPEVWEEAERRIGENPSTLRLVVPEAFLDEADERSEKACQMMEDYLKRDLFDRLEDSFVLLERETQSGKRIGLMVCVDLEDYDYLEGSQPLIRATEETVQSRIPPRLKVREQSKMEVSHVMLLADDPEDSLIGPLYQKRETLKKIYDLPLLMDGGQVKGWQIREEDDKKALAGRVKALKNTIQDGAFLFAVGDGNHSLATAKASWEKQKQGLSPEEQKDHPARFAMAELVNLHSEALLFEPIHRIAFDKSRQELLDILAPLSPEKTESKPDLILLDQEGDLPIKIRCDGDELAVAAVQRLLDQAQLKLDYVHGEDALREIRKKQGGTGILMPDFEKSRLFPTVQRDGKLPRKTFSMGEANEKRFYLEARRIRNN